MQPRPLIMQLRSLIMRAIAVFPTCKPKKSDAGTRADCRLCCMIELDVQLSLLNKSSPKLSGSS